MCMFNLVFTYYCTAKLVMNQHHTPWEFILLSGFVGNKNTENQLSKFIP